ncbi:MAG: CCA tRNA nucleotidyltransferase [Rhodospirillales bacterium]|nr:CCA tRNA nucleotidyltransferase [Rhodospirillales bacterium]
MSPAPPPAGADPAGDAPALRIPPPAFLADPPLAAILAALPAARLVGGCVRDSIAGHPIADIDLATPDPPAAVIRALAAGGLRTAPTGLAHGTVTAIAGHRGYEITTLRRDVATDGRHATVAFTDDWRADAARRDFTINALSMTADGAVFDYFGGLADLAAGRLRFVGDPAARLAEDHLRSLRFFRFLARYASAPPDAATLAALAAATPGLARLSPERVWSELKRILAAPDPTGAIALMSRLGILAAILPEGADPDRLARLVAAGAPADPLLRLAALLTGDPLALAARLRLSTQEATHLAALRTPAPEPGETALRQALADTPRPILDHRLWLADAPATAHRLLDGLAVPVFAVHGRDLAKLGIPAGPDMGRALARLRTWWRETGCTADRAACLAELRRWQGGPPDQR